MPNTDIVLPVEGRKKSVFFFDADNIDILPNSLSDDVVVAGLNGPLFFDECGKTVIKTLLKRYPLSFFFLLKNVIKIGRYGYVKQRVSIPLRHLC